ncbi:hypothetical protein [Aeromonas jandaei]|uniref:hypothetical protein n=1 Tax=Aeromonas jandaei TaxID=650 RepID=UPI003BA0D2FC
MTRSRWLPTGMSLLVLPLLLTGCAHQPDAEKYQSKVDTLIRLCTEETLPNSQARPEGFDLEQHLADLRAERLQLTRQLATPAGHAALTARLKISADDLDILCLKQALQQTQSQ